MRSYMCFSTMDWIVKVVFVLVLALRLSQSGRIGHDIGELKQVYDYNRVLLDNIPSPHYVVIPTQVINKVASPISTREHQLRHHGTYEHMKTVVIQFSMNEKKIKIKLERNDVLLSSGIMVKHFTSSSQQVIQKTVEHCYYHGNVKKDEWSSVAVSTCHGIRGVIQMHNETYVIQPLIGGGEGTDHPHVLYKATVSQEEKCGNSAGLWLPFHELHKGEFSERLKFLKAQKHNLGIDPQQPKVLRTGLVVDKFMYMGLNFSQQLVTCYTLEIANIVDLYYRDLDFHIALTYLEYWDVADRFTVSPHQRELLQKFQMYKRTSLPNSQFDVVYFLTGITLEGSSVGLAIPDSVCSERAVGIVKSGKPFEPQQTAATLAHMIGHSLGIDHDEDGGCECSDVYGCLMSIKVLAHDDLHSRMFSTCSKSDLDVSLSMGITSCLQGAPTVATQFTQKCGNSIVERGEECDCGSEQDCAAVDPCCDPHTCLLKFWAQCRSGPCCANCTVLDSTHMCRERKSECDIPEFCDGESGTCPFNIYIEDGHPCASGKGYCIGGICPTRHQQCADIWGPDAEEGNEECYQRFNPTGNFQGHCGRYQNTWNYARCQHQDILCGLLHCSGGNAEPLFYGADKGFSKTTISAKNVAFECKSVHGPAMMDMPHMGLVQDGTRCKDQHVCRNNRCVPLAFVPVLSCPGSNRTVICSGHGVCSPDDICFCDDGWSGADCSQIKSITTQAVPLTPLPVPPMQDPTSLIEVVVPVAVDQLEMQAAGGTTPTMQDLAAAPVTAESPGFSTTLLIIILASVVGGVVLVLGVTLICYRRRSPLKMTLSTRDSKGHGQNSDGKKQKLQSGKKWMSSTSEEESEMGELPPPPVIISDPNSLMPEKGILKNSCPKLTDSKRGSDDSGRSNQQRGSDSGASYVDQDSVGTYNYDNEEDDDEIREIFRENHHSGGSSENLENLPESASFDFVMPPPPPPQFLMHNMFSLPPGSYPHKMLSPEGGEAQPLMWRTALPPQTLSPPQSRIVRLRNFNDLMARFDKTVVDLSPSPDDPPHMQVSPSTTCTSEDVRSSETEGGGMFFYRGCGPPSHSDHSPTSVASSSTTQHTFNPHHHYAYQYQRPNGNLNQYLMKANNLSAPRGGGGGTGVEEEEDEGCEGVQSRPVHMPPPMHPINIRSLLGMNQQHSGNTGTGISRDSNEISHGALAGEPFPSQPPSNTGTATSTMSLRNNHLAYDKSSGYGSEHELGERLSTDDNNSQPGSQVNSRSQSRSPPAHSYSAVIRTGPNRLHLVAPGRLMDCYGKSTGSQEELQKLLENLPRIDAGSFERSPLLSMSATPSTPNTGPISMNASTVMNASKASRESPLHCDNNSAPHTPSASFTTPSKSSLGNPTSLSSTPSSCIAQKTDTETASRKESSNTASPGTPSPVGPLLPPPKPLSAKVSKVKDVLPQADPNPNPNLPCIDRSLEEIPQVFRKDKKARGKRTSSAKSRRPISLCVGNPRVDNFSADSHSSQQNAVQDFASREQALIIS